MPEGENPVAAPAAPAKKNNAAMIIIIVVVVLVVLGVGGTLIARWVAHRAADKVAGGILGAVTGSDVSVNSDDGSVSVTTGEGTTSTGSKATWPATMPSEVPKYDKGNIIASTTTNATDSTGQSWSVTIEDTNQTDYDAYKASLVAAGWSNVSSASFGGSIDAYEKGNYDLSLIFDPSSGGASVTVTPKS